MTDTRYIYNDALRIWESSESIQLPFSDGDAEEEYLANVFANARNLSSLSNELPAYIRDWSSEYHLSPLRSNLLRPFDFGPGKRVLEVGCGAGAITSQLGEKGLQVVALEGSRRRAALTAARCRQQENVKVVCDRFEHYRDAAKFDFVTLIGVLEYATAYLEGPDPVRQMLSKAFELLSDSGVLVIAIENRLGLKYFNGRPEDHLGLPYTGLHNTYPSKGPHTFGQGELSQHLRNAGFKSLNYFYPFPDYKLPTVIVADVALSQPGLRVGELLSRLESRSYDAHQSVSFDEGLVWSSLAQNSLVGALSNSFLVFAGKGSAQPKLAAGWLAKFYSFHFGPQMRCETSFFEEAGRLMVKKEQIAGVPAQPPEDCMFSRVLGEADYFSGELYYNGLRRLLHRGGSLKEVIEWAAPWTDFLRLSALKQLEAREAILPPDFVDCVPYNLVCREAGALCYIDREWLYSGELLLSTVFIRGMIRTLVELPVKGALEGLKVADVVADVAEAHDIACGTKQFQMAFEFDQRLSNFVNLGVKLGPEHELSSLSGSSLISREFANSLAAQVDILERELRALRGENLMLQEEIQRLGQQRE